MKIMSKIILTAFVFMGTIFSQSLQANYELTDVLVEYHWVVRAQESTLDQTGGYVLNGAWPSAATPAFKWALATFEVGDTAQYVRVPLLSQLALDFFPFGAVGLNCDFNDDGTFTINEGSTYPTTQLIDCETSSTVPPVTESGTWTDGSTEGDPHYPHINEFTNISSRGWGITESGTFAWFNAPDLSDGTDGGGLYAIHSQYDGYYDDNGNYVFDNWGRADVKYNDDFTQIEGLKIHWTANDGVESNLGIVDDTDSLYVASEEGMLNGLMGIAVAPSDSTTIPAIAALAATLGITIHVPDNPVALGGSGQDIDGDGEPDGLVTVNEGYLFDPVGSDGAPFSGDEPLQFTGYYFTYNFMVAVGTGQGTFNNCAEAFIPGCVGACMADGTPPDDQESCTGICTFASVDECIDDAASAVLTTFGLDATVAAGVAASVYSGGNVGGCLAGDDMTPGTADDGDALTCIVGGLVYAIGAAQVATEGAWMFPNDSGQDVEYSFIDTNGDSIPDTPYSAAGGRLLFEVDNLCLPRNSTQRIHAGFKNTANAHTSANPVFMPTAAGWNMVGLPITAGGYPVNFMFGMFDADGEEGPAPSTPAPTAGTLYSFDGSYNPEAAMAPGQGYWLRFDDACCDPAAYGVPGHPLMGYDILSQTINLREGWNMISGISVSAGPNDVDDPGDIHVEGSLYGFSGTYYSTESIEPGRGYWVRTSAAGAVTISIDTGGGEKRTEPIDYLKDANYLTITNGDGLKGMPLHFGATVPKNEQIRYGLPPLPPAGAFDSRFSDDMRYTENMGTIEIMNNTKFLSIDYYVLNQEKWTLTINGEEHLLEGSGVIELDGSITSVTLRKVGYVPKSFSVSQNYPNPFNPTTQIAFELPDPQTVNITVWNLKGQQVATVHTGELNAGFHSYSFDGSHLASGAYIYRVNAGPYQATKKMLLMK